MYGGPPGGYPGQPGMGGYGGGYPGQPGMGGYPGQGGMGGYPGQGGMGGYPGQGGMGGYPGQQGMNYNTMNWNGYQMGHYNVGLGAIDQYADMVFQRYDTSRTGEIPMYMLTQMITEFCNMSGSPPPSHQDMNYMMYTFDIDGDGRLSFWEWKKSLKMLGGHKQYSKQGLMGKAHKKHKYAGANYYNNFGGHGMNHGHKHKKHKHKMKFGFGGFKKFGKFGKFKGFK